MIVVLLRMGGVRMFSRFFCTDLIERYFCNGFFLSSDHAVYESVNVLSSPKVRSFSHLYYRKKA